MAIKGNLREASLTDVLQLLALGRKTGCLSVSDRSSFGRIFFDRGVITHASIVNRRDRLGDLLVKNEVVTSQQLSDAIAAQTGQNPPRLGEILISQGSLQREDLEHFIRIQIEEAVYFLFTWNQGTFYFEPGEFPDSSETLVSINPEGLLLEGARRVDEWTQIEKKVSSPDILFVVDRTHGNPEDSELSAHQRRVLPLMDGERSVREIVEDSGLMEFDACKAIFGLVQAGFARHRGRKREQTPESTIRPTRLQEHGNLGIAFYRTSMYEEAEREFLRILELDPAHLESHFYLGLIALRQKESRSAARRLMKLIEEGGRWPSAYHNLSLALELAGQVDAAFLTTEQGLDSFPNDRPLLLAKAILLTKQGKFGAAAEAFDRYGGAPGSGSTQPASYYAFCIIALAGAGRLGDAKRRAAEGVALHPRNAQLLTNAAAVAERAGDGQEAETLYGRAVDEGTDLPQAQRGLGDALYRRGAYDDAGAIYSRLVHGKGGAPGSADLLFKLGNIAYKRGDRKGAVRYWRETVQADPAHTVARTNLELVESVLAASNA